MKYFFRLLTVCLISSSTLAVNSEASGQDDSRYLINRSAPSVLNARYVQDDDQSPILAMDESPRTLDDMLKQIDPLRNPMSSISVDIRERSGGPADRSSALTQSRPETWNAFQPPAVAMAWAAPNIRYQPLYFENVRLERYGQTRGPWREVGDSARHFFISTALLPYHARFDHVRDCDYPLGFCRPGNSVPGTRQLHWWGW